MINVRAILFHVWKCNSVDIDIEVWGGTEFTFSEISDTIFSLDDLSVWSVVFISVDKRVSILVLERLANVTLSFVQASEEV